MSLPFLLRGLFLTALLLGLGTLDVGRWTLDVIPAAAQPQSSEIPTAVTSRAVSPRFEHLTLEDGLSQSTVHDFFQDSHGFIWMTTQDGLNRYDGYEVKTFTHEPNDDESFAAGFAFGMAEDRSGALWIASMGGLSRMDPLTEKFTTYRGDPDNPTSLTGEPVWDVTIDSEGTLWVGTNTGLNRMYPEHPGVFDHFVKDTSDTASLCDDKVWTTFEDSAKRLWVGTQNGVCITDTRSPGVFERIYMNPNPRSGGYGATDYEVYHFLERPEEPGILWAGTSKGLLRIDAQSRHWEQFVFDPDYRGDNRFQNSIWRLTQDPSNPSVLWIPTGGAGLMRFDIRAKRWVRFTAEPTDPNGLKESALQGAFADRSGVVWIGMTLNGASRFNPASVALAHFRKGASAAPQNLPGENVWKIYETRDGLLWVGTSDDSSEYLTMIDRKAGVSRHFRHDPNRPSSRDPGTVNMIFEDNRLNLWIGSSIGVDILDRATGSFTHIRRDPSDPKKLPAGVTAMLEDRAGVLWFGTFEGLAKMDPNRFGEFERLESDGEQPNSITPGAVTFLFEDLAGFLWVATRGGLNRVNPETGHVDRYERTPGDPSSLTVEVVAVVHERRTAPGILWIGTRNGGLNRLDVSRGEIRHFTQRDGLANNTIYGMLEDDLGNLWISTNRGLSKFDPDAETFRNYGTEIGLQSLEFSSHAYHRCQHGEFFFGGVNGLNAFFPNEISENPIGPEVELIDLKIFNQSVKSTGAVALERPLEDTDEIRLDYSQKDVSFDFVAFHFADPTGNSYAYKLDGFNDDWVFAGEKRTASFTNLAPGEYTFHVKAANSDGVWNEEGTSIRLIVEPPFWMTWWFRLLAALGVTSLLFVGYRARTAQLEARARQLESEVTKRTAELKASNTQLEQSQSIVEAINQETSFRRLLTKILEEARVMPGVEKATAIVRMPDGLYHVRASSGWDVDAMRDIRLTPDEANARYVTNAEELSKDIFLAADVAERAGSGHMAEFGNVASFLVLRINIEGDVAGYLVFDNLTDSDAFEQRDVELLERLREHITSAFIKTRILEDLQHTLDDLRATQDRLVQSEKMASLGQLTAGIAHEIKNPLNFVNNFSDMTREIADEIAEEIGGRRSELPADLVAELDGLLENLRINASKINEHGRRADGIVKNMLEHSRSGTADRVLTDINDLLEEYLVLAHHAQRAEDGSIDIHIERDLDEEVGKIEVVPQEMGRVFMNLIGNAFDALTERERLGLAHRSPTSRDEVGEAGPTVKVTTARNGSNVEIRISDNGPGIPPEVKSKIFEPFFTTKPTGSGTGLGLSMSYDIVTKGHGGQLDVISEAGNGATFVVTLPAS